MRYCVVALAVCLLCWFPAPASAQTDESGCKDHPLFNRMPNHYIAHCATSPFAARKFPVGPLSADGEVKLEEVEGVWHAIAYRPPDGTTPASPLQIQRNFQNAAKAAGGEVLGVYPEWCKLQLDESFELGNGCTDRGLTLKFTKDGKETWVFVNGTSSTFTGNSDGYSLMILEREAMTQDIVANELLERITKDGMVALYFNFETGSAALPETAGSQLDQIAAMMKADPSLTLEVGGHTDNVGDAAANQNLSAARAAAVVTALTSRGVAAGRLTSAGYGATAPIADNRTEDGRAKNRRVELVRQK
jgi:OmpA-OmpF porin, OOP family